MSHMKMSEQYRRSELSHIKTSELHKTQEKMSPQSQSCKKFVLPLICKETLLDNHFHGRYPKISYSLPTFCQLIILL